MNVDRPVGIDLGTTNSEIALLDPSERDLLVYADRFGRRTVPSAVAWDPKTETMLVGHAARARRGREPGPIESIKRKMGRAETVSVGPRALAPEEVSARILEELRSRMAEHLAAHAPAGVQAHVTRAVITVPAYFDAPQVEATRRAGELAGLEVLGILQEPTAAAIYHTWKRRLGDGVFLVYDLGGGTFDVSVLRCLGGEYQVLAIDGDNFLGGDDFDRRFAEVLRKRLVAQGYALDLDVRGDADDRARFARLVHLAQEIKESLSSTEVARISKSNVVEDKHGEPVSFEAEVGREEYESCVRDFVEATLAACERALLRAHEVAGVTVADLDHVVLVGGSTRVPLVAKRVTESLCARSKAGAPLADEVDTCVALGAAIHAARLGGLRLSDGDAQVLLESPLVTRRKRLRISLRVERAPDGVTAVCVEPPGDAQSLDEVPSGSLRFEVPVAEEGEHAVSVSLRAPGEKVLATLPFSIWRGDVRPRATALSQPSVVAKDLSIEVVRQGRRERRVLVARGTGLPARAEHRFFTADRTGTVVLRVLQNRVPIKSLALSVPIELPLGTPVDLVLTCDEAMRLDARATVAGQELWARIEPVSSSAELQVDALLERCERVGAGLWGSDAQLFRREAAPLVAGIREVLATDPDKLAALCARLGTVLDALGAGAEGALMPPLHRFEHVLDELRRTAFRARGPLVGLDRSHWEARIEELDARGRQAWAEQDAPGWKRTYNETQALLETAYQEEFAQMRLDDPGYLSMRLLSASTRARRAEEALADFVPSSDADVHSLQSAERSRLLEVLAARVRVPLESLDASSDASMVRRTLDACAAELSRIEDALERIPSLGLVTDRGA